MSSFWRKAFSLNSLLRSCTRYLATEERERYASALSLEVVTEILIKARARDIAVMDMKSKCNFTDYFVIATANDEQHIDRLGSAVLFELKEEMRKSDIADLATDLPPAIQGHSSSGWTVIDAGNMFVHLMTEAKREYYDLQSLWSVEDESVDRIDSVPEVLTKETIRIPEESTN